MSLILEALKKSEAERRLGQAPGLLSPAPASRRRHALWPLLAVLVLAVGLSTCITWWLLRPAPATTPPTAPVPDAAEPAAARTATATSAPAVAPPPAAAPGAAEPVPAPVPVVAAAPARTVRPAVERESAPQPAGGALPVPPAPELTAAAPVRNTGTATPAPGSEADAGAQTAAPAAGSEDAPAATDNGAAEPALPGVHALPRDVQSALPPLSVSMHVFNADPAQRFVLIDGRRYGEGMAVADGLLIEAIRRDGVVLVFRSHRFLLPRPG